MAIGVALGGDDAPVMVSDRDWFLQTIEARVGETLGLFAKFITALHVRSAALPMRATRSGVPTCVGSPLLSPPRPTPMSNT